MRIRTAIIVFSLSAIALTARTQAQSDPPDAPSASRPAATLSFNAPPNRTQRTRVSALPDAPSHTALSDSEKFQLFVESAQSPLTFASAGFNTSVESARGVHPYGPGTIGYVKSYTAALATKESNAFFSRYLFPRLLNQDPRYHPSTSKRMLPRAFYAASRVLITRNDKGEPTTNTSYLFSTMLTSSLANVYKPRVYRTWGNTTSDIATSIGGDAGMNVLREFWPQLRDGLSKIEPKPIRAIREKVSKKVGGDDKDRQDVAEAKSE